MSCQNCGAPAKGRLCRTCEDIRDNERRHGVPNDYEDGGSK